MDNAITKTCVTVLLQMLTACATTIAHNGICTYVPIASKGNPYPELYSYKNCGKINNGHLVVYARHLQNMSFNEKGLAEVLFDGKQYYLNKSGKTAQTHRVDSGADNFSEGLARVIVDKKYGFMDNSLNIVIDPRYDFAFPFENGIAAVCNNCISKSEGEHSYMEGGKWGAINRQGEVIIPIVHDSRDIYTRIDALSFGKSNR